MRPIPEHSTDFLYAGDFERDDLIEVGNALGVSNVNVVTTATLKPERVLYHACLNGIQTYVKLHHTGEVERAKEIADLADQMYADLQPAFAERVDAMQPRLEKKEKEATRFCSQLSTVEDAKPWNSTRYHNTWNTNDYPPRWQKKAIETYGTIRDRIEKSEYTPSENHNGGSLTTFWSLRNMEYKHYRDIARHQVEAYLQQNLPKDQLLTMQPATERTMTLFIGGMGSGKSTLTEHYLETPEDGIDKKDSVLHNADYLKYAMYRSAVKDGMLPDNHQYKGEEVQAESSNALYEGTRKRAFLARQKFEAPNVILNSIVLGRYETQEGIASGGKVVAHHVHISPEDAIIESEKRRASLGRAPEDSDVRWSAKASAQSLLLLTEPEYKGTDITVHLYHREAGKPPAHYATIDAANSTLYIHDSEAFNALSQTADINQDSPLSSFIQPFIDSGYAITIGQSIDNTKPIAHLDKAQHLTIIDNTQFDEHTELKKALLAIAKNVQVGTSSYSMSSPVQQGALYANR